MRLGFPKMLMQSYGDYSGITIEPILGVLTGHLPYSLLRYRTNTFAEKTPFRLCPIGFS